MKKFLALMVVVLCFTLLFVACKKDDTEVTTNEPATEAPTDAPVGCSHEYDNDCDDTCNLCGEKREPLAHVTVEIPAVEATCTSTGLTAGEKCSVCGEITKAQEVVPMKEHTEVEIPAKDATCTTSGNTAGRKCTVCNHITYGTVIPALGHNNAVIPAVESTCTETGLTAGKKCLRCGDITERQQTVAKKAHTEAEVAGKPATCTENGLSSGKYCTVCKTVTVAQQITPATGHTPGAAATCTEAQRCTVCQEVIIPETGHTESVVNLAPTCTDSGYEGKRVCLICGEVYENGTVVPALGHEWVEATCTSAKHCTRCDVVVGTYGHAWGEYTSNNDATCIADGTKTRTCSACNETETVADEGTKLGHAWGEYISNNDASCETSETQTAQCDRCDATDTITISNTMLGHNPEYKDSQAASCVNGWISYECSRCGEITIEVLTATGNHSWGIYVSDNNATCIADGTKTAKCANCDTTDTIDDEGSALGHNEVTHEAKAATCTEAGWNAYVTCTRCDYTTYEEIAAHHDYVEHEAQAATCTEAGWNAYVTCNGCDYTTYEEIGALGHDEVEHDAKAATCTEDGWNAYVTCSRCDYTTKEVIAAHHNYVTIKGTSASCELTGLTDGTQCSVCGTWEVEQEEIPATGHQRVNGTTGACTVCGDGCDHSIVTPFDGLTATCYVDGLISGERCNTCGAYHFIIDETDVWVNKIGDNWIGSDGNNYNETIIIRAHHTWGEYTSNNDATCTADGTKTATCTRCKTATDTVVDEGTVLGHDWADATCTAPKTCNRCQETEGEALGHDWADATCTAPKTCKRCELTEGEALGHDWAEATCTAPKTCNRCQDIDGDALGHKWNSDCQTKCGRCDYVRDTATPHEETNDGCDIVCKDCGEYIRTEHSFTYGECTGCGIKDPAYAGAGVLTFKEFVNAHDDDDTYYLASRDIASDFCHDGYVLPSQNNWFLNEGAPGAHMGYDGNPIKIASNAERLDLAFKGWIYFNDRAMFETFGVFVDGITSKDQVIYNKDVANHLDMYNENGALAGNGFENVDGSGRTCYYVTLFNTNGVIWNTLKNDLGVHTIYVTAKMKDGTVAVVFQYDIEIVECECTFPADGTTGVGTVTAPTCEEKGYTTVKCNHSDEILCSSTTRINYVDETGHNYSEDWTSMGGRHYHACLNVGCSSKADEAKCEGVDGVICDTCGVQYACRHVWNMNANGSFTCLGSCGGSISAPANHYEGNGLYTHTISAPASTFSKVDRLTYNSNGYVTITGEGREASGDTKGAVLCIADDVRQYVVFRYRTNKNFTLGLIEHKNNNWVNISATSEWVTAVFDMGAAQWAGRVDFRFNIDGGSDCVTDVSHFASFNSESDAQAWAETLDSINDTCALSGHNIQLNANGTAIGCSECKGTIWNGKYASRGDYNFLTNCPNPNGGTVTANGTYVTLAGCGTQMQYIDAAANRYVVVVYRKGTASFAGGFGVCYYNGKTSGSLLAFMSWNAGTSIAGNQVGNTIASTDGWVVGIVDMKCVSSETNSLIAFAPDNTGTGSADVAYYATFANEEDAKLFAEALAYTNYNGTFVEDDPCANGHTWGAYKSNNDATCTTDGTKTRTCTKCFETETIADEGSAGHKWGEYVSNNDATCTADGTKTAKCGNCDATDTIADEGSKTAHTEVAIGEAKAATCTEKGITAGKKCSECGTVIEAQAEIDTIAHTVENYKCTMCGAWNLAGLDEVEDGTEVVIGGQVRLINTAWSSTNGNISVTIYDDFGHSMSIFRLATEVSLGDYITVTGTMGTYNGNRQIVAGATATVDSHEDPVYAETELSDVGSLDNGTYVEVTGTVISIDTAWSSYGNMCVTISDGNGNTLYIYRLTTEVKLCDVITVIGTKSTYGSNTQIGENSTATIAEEKNHSYSEATCTKPATCRCGQTQGEALGHDYVDDTCSRCGAVEGAVEPETTTVTVSIADYATTNGWADGKQYSKIDLDSNITATATGGNNTGKYYTNGTNWRIYQNETPSLTITAADGKTIKSVKITYAIGNTGILTLNGENVATNTEVDVNAESITFSVGNTGTATNGQAKITAIEVIYY